MKTTNKLKQDFKTWLMIHMAYIEIFKREIKKLKA